MIRLPKNIQHQRAHICEEDQAFKKKLVQLTRENILLSDFDLTTTETIWWHHLWNRKLTALVRIGLEIWQWISRPSLDLGIRLWDETRCRWWSHPTSVAGSGWEVEAWVWSTTLCSRWLSGNSARGLPPEEECLWKQTHHWQLLKRKVNKSIKKKTFLHSAYTPAALYLHSIYTALQWNYCLVFDHVTGMTL